MPDNTFIYPNELVRELHEALWFYADQSNYDEYDDGRIKLMSNIEADYGERATQIIDRLGQLLDFRSDNA